MDRTQNREKKNRISMLYALMMGFLVFLLCFLSGTERAEVYRARQNPGYHRVENYAYYDVEDADAPIGVYREYRWNLEEIPRDGVSLTFYTVHQEAEVYFDNELMYRLKLSENNEVGKTTASNWILLPLYPEDSGKEVRIRITPAYESVRNREMVFLVGSQIQIFLNQLRLDLPQLLLSIFAIIVGLVFIGIAVYGMQKRKMDSNLVYLGLFSVLLGNWRLCDIRFSTLLFAESSVMLSYISLAMLLAAPVPLLRFLRSQFGERWHRLVDGASLASIAVSFLLLLLQFTGIADFRETLSVSHGMIGLTAIVIAGIVLFEDTGEDGDEKAGISLTWFLLCAAGVAADLLSYYMNKTSAGVFYTLAAFLFYVVAMGILSIRELNQKAYVDLHTGLFNKSRCNEILKDKTILREPTGLMMFDLNNLKRVNDTQGHEAGDSLIFHFASILRRAVPAGTFVGRYGGDEFIIVVRMTGAEEVQRILAEVEAAVRRYNREAGSLSISYSAGYSHSSDFAEPVLQQLLEQADSDMYQKKKRYHLESPDREDEDTEKNDKRTES